MTLQENLALAARKHQDALLRYIELKREHTTSGLALGPARREVLLAEDDLRELRQDILAYEV